MLAARHDDDDLQLLLCNTDPRLSNPSQDAKEVLLWSREELGSI